MKKIFLKNLLTTTYQHLMIYFYDINSEIELKPKLEFKSKIKFDPFKILTENLFAIALSDNNLFLFIDKSIYQFTPEFKFKLEKPPLAWDTIAIYSAEKNYLEALKQYLSLEPCFKLRPPADANPKEIKKFILASSCRNGFLEINSFSKNPEIDIIIIETGKELEMIEFSEIELEKINRILIYDFEKNACNLKSAVKNSQQRAGESESFLHRKLFDLISNYFEKNVSAKIIWDLPFDRNAIFREHATPETLEKTFNAIKKAIEKIKLNQKEHKEKIKELISIFYSENYNELEKLNLTTTIEKLYAEL